MEQRYIAALEIAGSQVKGAVAVVPDKDSGALSIPTIVALATDETGGCVQYGRVLNTIDAAKHASFVVQRLENDPAVLPGKITSVFVGLEGRSLASQSASAELVMPHEMQITAEIVERLYLEATKAVPEGREALKVLPRKFIVDTHLTTNPVGELGTKLRGEFTVVTCSKANRRNLELVIEDSMKLPVAEFIVTPLAEAELVLGEEEKQLGCVLVDMGIHTTTVSIYKDRALQYLVTLPLGSGNITRDIATGLNITEERAELAKCTQGNALPEAGAANSDAAKVNCYVQARVGEIVANITAQIGYANYTPQDLAAGFVLTGRGTKLTNFAKFLESQSRMKVRMAAVPPSVALNVGSVTPGDYLSLFAIVARAVRSTHDQSSLTFPASATTATETPETRDDYNGYDDIDDDDVLIDDDEADRLRNERISRAERDAAHRAEVEERRRQKAEDDAARKARKAEERRKKQEEEQREPKETMMSRLKRTLTNIISTDSDQEDADLDDEN